MENTNDDICCPLDGCVRKFEKIKSAWKDMQHHLYMMHGMEVMESHKLAKAVTARALEEEAKCAS